MHHTKLFAKLVNSSQYMKIKSKIFRPETVRAVNIFATFHYRGHD